MGGRWCQDGNRYPPGSRLLTVFLPRELSYQRLVPHTETELINQEEEDKSRKLPFFSVFYSFGTETSVFIHEMEDMHYIYTHTHTHLFLAHLLLLV